MEVALRSIPSTKVEGVERFAFAVRLDCGHPYVSLATYDDEATARRHAEWTTRNVLCPVCVPPPRCNCGDGYLTRKAEDK